MITWRSEHRHTGCWVPITSDRMIATVFKVFAILLTFAFKGLVLNLFVVLQLIYTYPIAFITVLGGVYLLYQAFLALGFNQRRSIKLSSPYQDGQHFLDQLSRDVRAPHNFYHLGALYLSRPMYCFCCHLRIDGLSLDGICCDTCGFTAHHGCVNDISEQCKEVSTFNSMEDAVAYANIFCYNEPYHQPHIPHDMSEPASLSSSPTTPTSIVTSLHKQHEHSAIPQASNSNPDLPSSSPQEQAEKKSQDEDQDLIPDSNTASNRRTQRRRSLRIQQLHRTTSGDSDSDSDDPEAAAASSVPPRNGKQQTASISRQSPPSTHSETSHASSTDTETPPKFSPVSFPSSSPSSFPMLHHWVRGNHSSISDICFVCTRTVGSLFYPDGLHCLWCGLYIHEDCLAKINKEESHHHAGEHHHYHGDGGATGSHHHHHHHPQHDIVSPQMFGSEHTPRIHPNYLSQPGASTPGSQRPSASSTPQSQPQTQTPTHPSPLCSSTSSPLSLFNAPSSLSQTNNTIDRRFCTMGALAKCIIPPYSVYPSKGYTVQQALMTIYSQFTNDKVRQLEKARQSTATPAASPSAGTATTSKESHSSSLVLPDDNTFLDYPRLFSFVLPPWCYPLLVFVNRRSGSNTGVKVMHDFLEMLNPIQVWDLSTFPAELALTLFKYSRINFRVLVCGGDGSISSVLHSIDRVFGSIPVHLDTYNPHSGNTHRVSSSLHMNHPSHLSSPSPLASSDGSCGGASDQLAPPPVAVLPLGTGNDLAQVLGWGGRLPDKPARQVLYEIMQGRLCVLDRWNVSVTPFEDLPAPPPDPPSYDLPRQVPHTLAYKAADLFVRTLTPLANSLKAIFPLFSPNPTPNTDESHGVMNNYLGFGIDAVMAHQFSTLRDQYPHLFFHQLVNKLWYTRIGFGQWLHPVMYGGIKSANHYSRVYVDGVELQNISHLQGICCLGIKSFGGGVCFWGDKINRDEDTEQSDPTSNGRFQQPALDDGMFELIGFESSFHMALIQTGFSLPHRLAQGRVLHVDVYGALPLQIDGEQWGVRSHARITVSLRTQSMMIAPLHGGPTQNQNAIPLMGTSTADYQVNLSHVLRDTLQSNIEKGVLTPITSSMIMTDFTKRFNRVFPSSYFYSPLPLTQLDEE